MLTGDRVVLRPFRPEDREALWRARLDRLTWARTTDEPYGAETLEAYVERMAAPRGGQDAAAFAVELDEVLIGSAALFGVDRLARNAEVGLHVLAAHQGQGHGRDALRVLVDLAFTSRNLHRVHLQTLSSNEAAVRCYTAVGFVEEGRLREHAWVEGAYEDVVLMGLLRSER